ncbi:uncharacterized protein LOC108206323 isoform X2 [Daucus carota subsp. sativus]|nr:PREDICTED: uncharacterized protein LOC108206323 isoform X2 [Daucus carota subsp. sativus]
MEEDANPEKLLHPYELSFSDLLLLSSDEPLSENEIQRLDLITTSIMENLGPNGPGLLAVTAVPGASSLRSSLLRFAPQLALLDFRDLNRLLKENGLGSDVPLKNLERTVSPFTMHLKYGQGVLASSVKVNQLGTEDCMVSDRQGESWASDIKILRNIFEVLGSLMIELGCRLARVCDRVIGDQNLEQSLFEACTAKGRLIHYHSGFDNNFLQEISNRKEYTKGHRGVKSFSNAAKGTEKLFRNNQTSVGSNGTKCDAHEAYLWQQWHYDYGIFTILTEPMFLLPSLSQTTNKDDFPSVLHQELPSPSGHSYLQIYHPSKNGVYLVKMPPDSFLIQVGESADILSKARLRATLHSVGRPARPKDLSRENFVVFLHPAWGKTFSLLNYPVDQQLNECTEESHTNLESEKLAQEIYKIVPPLSTRLKEGMTFAEFSKATTKQYYGGSGLQSKRT